MFESTGVSVRLVDYMHGLEVPPPPFGVEGSGLRVQGRGFRVQGSGFRVQVSGFRVQGLG